MRCYWFMLSGLCLAGCVASNGLQYEAVSETNQYHLARVRKGMSEREVLFIMHKPYSYETFQAGEDVYDVWFYVTRMTALDQTRMVPQNLTPLTFKNGVLVGTGYSWYYYAMKEQAKEMAEENPPPPPPKSQEEEDREFEKALKTYTPPQQPAAPPPAQPVQSPPPAPAQPTASPPPKPVQSAPAAPAQPTVSPPPKTPSAAILHTQGPMINLDQRPSEIAKGTVKTEEKSSDIATGMEPVAQTSKVFLKPWPLGMIQKNQLKKISEGMTETEVTNTLGVPSRYETFQMDQDVYDVWFYEISPANNKKSAETLPLTFKNSVLVGMTKDFYTDVKQASKQERVDGYDRNAEQMQQQESEQNFDFW